MAFSFVNYEGPDVPQDPSVRTLIRRQAMRDVGLDRRARGGYGQANLRQVPIFVDELVDHSLRLGIGKLSSFKSDLLQARDWAGSSFRASSSSSHPPSHDLGNPALAHFITTHYADVPALRYATDCVTAQLRQLRLRSKGLPTSPPHGKDTPLLLYNKALRAIQAALEDDTQRLTEETLCATELLAVFELLNENVPSWMHHAGGAAQLIQIRGAHRFRSSESGTALFLAHIGTSVMDAFLSNKACFLEEASWTELMRSVIREDPPLVHLQDLSVAIWSHIVTGPGKFKAVTDIISGPKPPHQGTRETIILYLLGDRASLVGWMERAKRVPGLRNEDFEIGDYGIMFPHLASENGDGGDHIELDRMTRLSLWGTNIMCRILKTRLLIAMAPSRFRALEEECQYLAAKVKALDEAAAASKHTGSGLGNGMGGLLQTAFISQNSWIVQGVMETKEIWADVSDEKDEYGNDKMIEKWKFDAWCKAIGRKLTTSSK
ncbi:hypothetical protein SBRCBS47491_004421 [Sporothrix bragantina]|uniref:Uncharacterized protein n=1 Tax=Sporothrix bragantina TaxID=671064 RepID=A0ABP0BN61_9PEZI